MLKYQAPVASLVFVFMLCLPSVSKAYGVKHTTSGNEVRWGTARVSLRIDPALEGLLESGQVRSAAVMASEAWRGFGNAPTLAIEVGAPPAYDSTRRGNGIYLLNKWPFKPQQLAVTVVTFNQDGSVLGADVLVNGEKPFALFAEGQDELSAESYDLASVLTHELGHVLGLDESYQHPEATMFPQIRQGETRPRVLAEDDQQGVMDIYHTPLPAAAPQMACAVRDPGTNVHRGALCGVLAGATLLGLGRRRRIRASANGPWL